MSDLARLEMIRLMVFLTLVGFFFLVEWKWSFWKRKLSPEKRQLQNIFIVISNSIIARLSVAAWPVLVAGYASQHGIGLFTILSNIVSPSVIIVITVIILDLAIYLQHTAFHSYAWLWAIHAPHHADPDLDFTTGFRFHIFEIILSLIYKSAVVLIFGLHPVGVLIFEIILNASAMFNHANIKMPEFLERMLSKIIVTPSLHRVHHSRKLEEADNNYGFTIVLWDRIFETLIEKSSSELEAQDIGLPESKDFENPSLKQILLMPIKLFSLKRQ